MNSTANANGTTSRDQSQPVTLINTFYPKPGKLDEFVALQVEEARSLGGAARQMGWRGNRIHRSRDGTVAVIVTVFESAAAKQRWTESEQFAEHLRRIGPLLDRVESRECDFVAGYGAL